MRKSIIAFSVFLIAFSGKISAQASLNFDGVDDYASIPNAVSSSPAFTIEFWMKTTQTGSSGAQWYSGKGLVDAEIGGEVNDFGISLNGSKVSFGIGNPDITINSVSDVNTGNWVHVAAVWAAGSMKLYINGTLDISQTSGVPTANRTAPSNIILGQRNG